ncbi:MAG: hypothetical protein ABSA42_05220 [Terracidiphilus sp.]|jgi:hypothetical protein
MGFFAICNIVAAYLGVYLLDDAPAGNNTRIIQVVAGVLAVIVLVIIIQRRRTRVK